jgi:hypothetical protein
MLPKIKLKDKLYNFVCIVLLHECIFTSNMSHIYRIQTSKWMITQLKTINNSFTNESYKNVEDDVIKKIMWKMKNGNSPTLSFITFPLVYPARISRIKTLLRKKKLNRKKKSQWKKEYASLKTFLRKLSWTKPRWREK